MKLSERIRIMLVKNNNISAAELARRMGISPQNLNKKLKKDDFYISDLEKVAAALDCTLTVSFISNATGDEITS